MGSLLGGSTVLAEYRYDRIWQPVWTNAAHSDPEGGVIVGSDGVLYGTTTSGGNNGGGSAFRVNRDGTGYSVIHSFDRVHPEQGSRPQAALLEGSDGALYGTTFDGGDFYEGTIFRLNKDGTGFKVLRSFDYNNDGGRSTASLIEISNDTLCGVAGMGGTNDYGTIFVLKKDGTGFRVIYSFGDTQRPGYRYYDGHQATGVRRMRDGSLCGTTTYGGEYQQGTVFSLSADGSNYQILHHFGSVPQDGRYPAAPVIEASDGWLYGTTTEGGLGALGGSDGIVFKLSKDGGTYVKIVQFDMTYSDGIYSGGPATALTEGKDGLLYGTTYRGGDWGLYGGDYSKWVGTVFRIDKSGTPYARPSDLGALHPTAGDGSYPSGPLVEGGDGYFYGTASQGGANGNGTVFRASFVPYYATISAVTDFRELRDGQQIRGLIQGKDGALYGTAAAGGFYGKGVVFKLPNTANPTAVPLHDFLGGGLPYEDGEAPVTGVIEASDGLLYGVTYYGGAAPHFSKEGIAYRTAKDGSGYTITHKFLGYICNNYQDGYCIDATWDAGYPTCLIEGRDGFLYGSGQDCWYGDASLPHGTVFRLPKGPSVSTTLLTKFSEETQCASPVSILEGADGGDLFGTTSGGGVVNRGIFYRIPKDGSHLSILASFDQVGCSHRLLFQSSDGQFFVLDCAGTIQWINQDGSGLSDSVLLTQVAGLLEGPNRVLYGVKRTGGNDGYGFVFSTPMDSVPFDPSRLDFVYSLPATNGYPTNAFFQGVDGCLYGVTDQDVVYRLDPAGSTAVSKPQSFVASGDLTNRQWQYFRVPLPAASPGWRIVLNSFGANTANLYLRKDSPPDLTHFDRAATGQTYATLLLNAAQVSAGDWYIGVYLPSGTTYFTLTSEPAYSQELGWDPGIAPGGTVVYTNSSISGGDYFFHVAPQATRLGIWRIALKVLKGEADIYLGRNGFQQNPANYERASARVGDDGFTLHSSEFTPGQDWYIMVRAAPGSLWTILSGDAFAYDLGQLATNSASGTNVAIPPEGTVYFKTTIPAQTLAWRLWLNGATNTLYVKKSFAPHPLSYELIQQRAMLVVPPYLNTSTFNGSYFVAVPGDPGTPIALDSRQQPALDLPFNTNTVASLELGDFPYLTYRVQVPVQQIAWQLNLSPSLGNPNLAVRRDLVPNEFRNDAYSDVPGSAGDSVTLVPAPGGSSPGLSDGTFFVTVYGDTAFTASFTNGNPVTTPIAYTFNITNDAPDRVGWRYYVLNNIPDQLGSLGWDLLLSNAPPGTEIALRRNAVPGRWRSRDRDNVFLEGTQGYVDVGSTSGFLQQPGHQADIWYVGVYSPTQTLGNFVLSGRPLTGAPIALDGGATNMVSQAVGQWTYFRLDIPTDAGLLGWDLRLTNVSGGNPQIYIRRDVLPTQSLYDAAGGADWTGYYNDPAGAPAHVSMLVRSIPRRIQSGATYYVGIINYGPDATSYSLLSRGIGSSFSIPVVDLPFTNGVVSAGALPAREAAYYKVVIPSNTPSWKVKLTLTSGEALVCALKDYVPGSDAYAGWPITQPESYPSGKKMQKPGNEHLALFPDYGQTNIPAGTYYLAVVSEGQNPSSNQGRIGTGTANYMLSSVGVVPVLNLGTLSNTDLIITNGLEGAEIATYQFNVASGISGLEAHLENKTGNPSLTLNSGGQVPAVGNWYSSYSQYGNQGGDSGLGPDFNLITVANPAPGLFTATVFAYSDNTSIYPPSFPAATYTLRIHPLPQVPVAFDGPGNSVAVTNQQAATWQYFRIDIPTNSELVGWDLRLTNVSAGNFQIYIRRDFLPSQSVYDDVGSSDWTGYYYDSTGAPANVNMLVRSIPRRIQPGATYYVGIYDFGSVPGSYTLLSRGIGSNYSLPVVELPFTNGVVSASVLPAREAAYYKVVVPSNTPSWKVKLAPTSGDALLCALKDYVPGSDAYSGWPVTQPESYPSGKKMQKPGNEHLALFPDYGQTVIPAGTYYLAVVSEGQNPNGNQNRIGTGTADYTLSSVGVVPVIDPRTVSNSDLLITNALGGGEIGVNQFTVAPGVQAFEARLENKTGNPSLTLISGAQVPSVGNLYGQYSQPQYGNQGGQIGLGPSFNLITVANPTPGLFTANLFAYSDNTFIYPLSFPDSGYTLRIHPLPPAPVAFDGPGNSAMVTNQQAAAWQYFRVDVPTNSELVGWDLRLTNVSGGNLQIYIRRDFLPSQSAYDEVGGSDWTGYYYDSSGAPANVNMLVRSIPRRIQPGATYYVGIYDYGSAPGSYTLLSRGIGSNYSLPVFELPFTNGVVSASVLPAREAAYYKVVVPSNTPSWKVKLAPSSGDVLLCALKDYVPQNDAYNSSLVTQPQSYPQGKKMQKPGNEHLALFPDYAQTEIPAGTYFLAVVSEGQNPDSNLSRIGTGTADYTLATVGVVPLVDLGTVSNADLWITNALEGGEIATYQFTTADGVPNLEVRLEDKIGNPSLTLRSDDQTPSVGNLVNNSGQSYYGNQGGQTPGWQSYSIISVPNPSVARFTATIFAYTDNPFGYSFTFPNAAYKLRVHPPTIALLNFSSNLNTNGSTNAASAQLADNQRAFFQVVVPETIAGAPVLGWKLDLFQNSGSPSFRVRKDLLPTDTNPSSQTFFITGSGLIAPPYLTPGSWFVEIKGSGNTDFTLVSSALTINELQRPIWSMPGEGQSLSSSNLVMPVFGDTAVAGDGSLLPGDGGTDLQAGRFDYYAVSVPTNNVGLLRTELQAISGNPNLYLRAGAAPTPSHYAQGQAGATLYDHSLTGSGNTKYGNWVPLDGRFERHLTNGLWLVAVQAGGTANARYRLKVSCGNVTPNALVQSIALDGLSVANQSLAGRDWRYYRFMVPSNPPASINLSFSRSLGNARVFLRDTVPPGDGSIPYDYDFYSSSHYERSWYSDSKNQGPYPRFDTPGSYSLPTPPLRPGAAYYLGVWSFNDTTFSLSLSTDTNVIVISNRLGFYGGTVSDSLPAFGARLYDIDVPPDATRLQLYATNSASVIFTLEQGTLPQVSGGAHWRSSGANVSLNQPLSLSFWPWQPDQSYYLLVTNSSASSQPFALFSEGRNTFTEQTPGILRVTAIQAGVISEVEFVGEPLRVYRLLFSSNLADWMMFTNVSSLTGTSRVSTATAPQTGSGFYRTVTP